ncbi:MAG TPA: CoA transferase [Dehalococcoidia bacterium]|jgi:benzylsuccinate CoA-transferase BbsF subunit|nr:CoA transferase [Dehalococcoidia bacterium]
MAPLAGIRVADFSWFGAGPIAGLALASFGAEVIRVESQAHMDGLRSTQPVPPGKSGPNVSGYFNNFNAGKLSFTLNMGQPGSRELALELLKTCDVLLENYTPRVLEQWGLTYSDVVAVRPDIIYCNVPMQGSWGPHRDFLGFGAVLAPVAGYSYLSGWPDRPPIGIGTNYPDYVINPGHAVVAILAALRHRDLTGEGQQVEVSQLESTINGLGPALLDYTVNGHVTERNGNRCAYAAPHGAFPTTGDDRWCVIAVFDDAQWDALKEVMGRPAWAEDDCFATLLERKQHEDALEARIADWTREQQAEALAELLQSRGVPAGVVQTAEDVLDHDKHLLQRGAYVYLDHPEAGHNAYDAPRALLSATPGELRAPAPLIGEHNDYVLNTLLGVPEERMVELLVQQVVY